MVLIARMRVVVALAFAVALSGCVGDKAEYVHSVWRTGDAVPTVSTVFYVTDREPDKAWQGGFAKQWGDAPSCGAAEATIPALNLPGQPIPTGSIRPISALQCGSGMAGIASAIALSARTKNCSEVFLYIHGFNTLFDGAVLRSAQLVNDTKSGCVAATFDWTSEGEIGRYIPDIEHSAYATPLLAEFLRALSAQGLRIDILGHSMGNRVLLQALAGLKHHGDTPREDFIDQMILAAADVGADPVNNDFAHLLNDARPFAHRITIYASAGDAVLAVSAVAHGDVARAGHRPIGDGKLQTPHAGDHVVDVVDATDAPAELLGHSYFAMSFEAISDTAMILRDTPIEARTDTLVCKSHDDGPCDPVFPHYHLIVANDRKPDFFVRLIRRLAPLVPRIELAPLTGSPE
ncbi:MAG TPA: alpha/beta hydrolase [Rhizomicrobium sp.]|nr:alpha/beta hydrolase [Rhizomicrobium sp.]